MATTQSECEQIVIELDLPATIAKTYSAKKHCYRCSYRGFGSNKNKLRWNQHCGDNELNNAGSDISNLCICGK